MQWTTQFLALVPDVVSFTNVMSIGGLQQDEVHKTRE